MNLLKVLLIFSTLNSAVLSLSFTITSQIYMDIKHNKKPLGRIVFGLFGKNAPKTVTNFRHICLRGINGSTYVGTEFHRVINRFVIQGGDILYEHGRGSISIYGKFFEDEALDISHNRPGYLGMANKGPNTNGCQFYITTAATKWLDGKNTVFGKVIDGMDTIYAIDDVKTDTDDHPLEPVVITNCGEIPTDEYTFYPDDFSIVGWIKAAGIPVFMSLFILTVFHYIYRQLDMYC